MNKKELTNFLLKARIKTYAGKGGKVKSAFKGSDQLEYSQGKWFYRDIYYTGKGTFMGLDTVYYDNKPVWSSSYYGNYKKMTEKEIDDVLRKALIENWKTTRIWERVEWAYKNYKYICEPDFNGSIEELGGTEKIFKNNKQVYTFYYAGSIL